ncbi:LytTR family DNA-binding domain-containing protein [Martelella radicis]|uniref:HTH LytTR-type domain-containing protein n=1 Tax=Martelella radicis TaxID=1397476 RepID=A0A7W6KGT9_9HYPH|nr:LytTR family DNA-binding domain-containing protein [Martelella radicis]MBB4121011.1 hypothetical protein [Martelella radicis]
MNEERENFAEDTAAHYTLRELRRDFANWRTYAVLAIAVLVLGWSGPFGTSRDFAIVPRICYWAATILPAYSAAHTAALFTGFHLRARKLPRLPALAAIVLVAGSSATIAVVPVALVVEGREALTADSLWFAAWHGILIAAAVVAAAEIMGLGRSIRRHGSTAVPVAAAPRLLARLPLEKRGRLVSLSVSDHYVDVVTTRGRAMLLIRLKDAIGEADPEPGIQIHRSHWVALAGVEKVERADGRLSIITSAGEALPVSRSYLADVRAAGLLPG